MKFRFVPKVRRNSVLCSREISLKRSWIVPRTFARTFLESSRKQRTKFAHFACVTFAQYCIYACMNVEQMVGQGTATHCMADSCVWMLFAIFYPARVTGVCQILAVILILRQPSHAPLCPYLSWKEFANNFFLSFFHRLKSLISVCNMINIAILKYCLIAFI